MGIEKWLQYDKEEIPDDNRLEELLEMVKGKAEHYDSLSWDFIARDYYQIYNALKDYQELVSPLFK